MAEEIYIIEQLWTDEMENSFDRACGYKTIGYVDTEQLAKAIAESVMLPAEGWPLSSFHMFGSEKGKPVPKYRYRKLSKVKVQFKLDQIDLLYNNSQ